MGRLSVLRRKKGAPQAGASDPPLMTRDSCPNCSEDLSVLDAFCPKCGTVLAEEE